MSANSSPDAAKGISPIAPPRRKWPPEKIAAAKEQLAVDVFEEKRAANRQADERTRFEERLERIRAAGGFCGNDVADRSKLHLKVAGRVSYDEVQRQPFAGMTTAEIALRQSAMLQHPVEVTNLRRQFWNVESRFLDSASTTYAQRKDRERMLNSQLVDDRVRDSHPPFALDFESCKDMPHIEQRVDQPATATSSRYNSAFWHGDAMRACLDPMSTWACQPQTRTGLINADSAFQRKKGNGRYRSVSEPWHVMDSAYGGDALRLMMPSKKRSPFYYKLMKPGQNLFTEEPKRPSKYSQILDSNIEACEGFLTTTQDAKDQWDKHEAKMVPSNYPARVDHLALVDCPDSFADARPGKKQGRSQLNASYTRRDPIKMEDYKEYNDWPIQGLRRRIYTGLIHSRIIENHGKKRVPQPYRFQDDFDTIRAKKPPHRLSQNAAADHCWPLFNFQCPQDIYNCARKDGQSWCPEVGNPTEDPFLLHRGPKERIYAPSAPANSGG